LNYTGKIQGAEIGSTHFSAQLLDDFRGALQSGEGGVVVFEKIISARDAEKCVGQQGRVFDFLAHRKSLIVSIERFCILTNA
jgi:hypothetical protein